MLIKILLLIYFSTVYMFPPYLLKKKTGNPPIKQWFYVSDRPKKDSKPGNYINVLLSAKVSSRDIKLPVLILYHYLYWSSKFIPFNANKGNKEMIEQVFNITRWVLPRNDSGWI